MIYYCDMSGTLRKIAGAWAKRPGADGAAAARSLRVGGVEVLKNAFLYTLVVGDDVTGDRRVEVPYTGRYKVTCIGRGGNGVNNGVDDPSAARVAGGGSGASAVGFCDVASLPFHFTVYANARSSTTSPSRIAVSNGNVPVAVATDGGNACIDSGTGLAVGGAAGVVVRGEAALSSDGNPGVECHVPDGLGELYGYGGPSVGGLPPDPEADCHEPGTYGIVESGGEPPSPLWGYGAGGTDWLHYNNHLYHNDIFPERGRTMDGYVRIERMQQ